MLDGHRCHPQIKPHPHKSENGQVNGSGGQDNGASCRGNVTGYRDNGAPCAGETLVDHAGVRDTAKCLEREKKIVGLIAQELREVLPNAVTESVRKCPIALTAME